MSSFYSSNLRILVAKKETTNGTAIAFADSDFDVRIIDPVVTPIIEADDEASKYATGDHGEDASIMGAQSATIEFSVKMSSSAGSSLSKPSWWKFAEACGCYIKEYGIGNSIKGHALQPKKSQDISTMTIRVYDFPRGSTTPVARYTFTGCMGNMTIGAEGVGKPWVANFSFTGKLVDIAEPTANEIVPKLSIDDTAVAEKMLNYELFFREKNNTNPSANPSQKISSFQLDVGNEISPLIDQADPTGYAYYAITKRSPRFSCDPLMNSGFKDIYNDWKNETTFPVTLCPASNSSAGFTLYLPKAQQLTAGIVSREGLVNWELNLKALRSSDGNLAGDAEVTWELLIGARS